MFLSFCTFPPSASPCSLTKVWSLFLATYPPRNFLCETPRATLRTFSLFSLWSPPAYSIVPKSSPRPALLVYVPIWGTTLKWPFLMCLRLSRPPFCANATPTITLAFAPSQPSRHDVVCFPLLITLPLALAPSPGGLRLQSECIGNLGEETIALSLPLLPRTARSTTQVLEMAFAVLTRFLLSP